MCSMSIFLLHVRHYLFWVHLLCRLNSSFGKLSHEPVHFLLMWLAAFFTCGRENRSVLGNSGLISFSPPWESL